MLVLPTKKADAYDVTKPLSAFFAKEYPSEEAAKYNESLTSFQNIRNNAILVNASSGQLGFHNILRYNHHMSSMSKRLGGYESEIKFGFTWVDSFQHGKRIQTGSLHHDWACVLWNLAALESSRGAHEDRATNDGIKTASLHFQQAAGVFALLKTEIVPNIQGAKSQELSDNFLSILQDLNLAQAQICFYEKAVKDRKAGTMKAGLVAKLAKQVAKFYEQAVNFSRDKEATRCLDPSWIHHMDFQRECFHGAAEYWQAHAVKDDALATGTGFGEEIARLTRAEEIFTRTVALGKSKRVHAGSLSTAENFLDTVKRLKFTAAKDNATIYYDKIPESRALAEVSPIAMVKPAPLPNYPTNPNISAEPPLFSDVLPKDARSLLTLYRERVASMVSQTEGAATNATNAGRASLSAIGLPGSLEVYKSGGSFPSNLWKKIQHVQMRGGGGSRLGKDLAANTEELERLASRARGTIDSIEYSIRREENIDKRFRERFPTYSVPLSSELNKDITRNVQLMQQAHDVAKGNDQNMISRVQGLEFQEYLHLLGMTLEQLEAQLPKDSSPSSGGGSLVNTADLEAYLVQIATLFETRTAAVAQLKASVLDKEAVATEAFCLFVAKLAGESLSPAATDEALASQLQTLGPLTSAVTSTMAEQQQLLDKVIAANDAFNNARSNDPLQKERERVIKRLEQAITAYSQSLSQLTAGSTFYMDMQSRLTSLMQQCDDLSYTQQLQRQEFEVESMREQERESQMESDHGMALRLAEEMDRMNAPSTDTTGPPPLPPKPQLPSTSEHHQQHYQQQPQQQQQQYGYPQLQQQQQQPPQQQQHQAPAPMGAAYGQPISGPPAGSTPQPLQQQQQQLHQQQQQQLHNQQQQQLQQQNVPSPSHSYSTHFQAPTPSVPQAQDSGSVGGGGGYYVYNAGFGGGGGGGVNSVSQNQPQQHQYNPGYQPPPQSQPQQQQQQQPPQPSQGQAPVPTDENKVGRLMEMGFPRDSVVAYLAANGNNEEAALNGLLSGTSLPSTPSNTTDSSNSQGQGPPPPPEPDSGGGFFSKLWGS